MRGRCETKPKRKELHSKWGSEDREICMRVPDKPDETRRGDPAPSFVLDSDELFECVGVGGRGLEALADALEGGPLEEGMDRQVGV